MASRRNYGHSRGDPRSRMEKPTTGCSSSLSSYGRFCQNHRYLKSSQYSPPRCIFVLRFGIRAPAFNQFGYTIPCLLI